MKTGSLCTIGWGVQVVHSQVEAQKLGRLGGVDTGFHVHCRSLAENEGPARRWVSGLEQICCLRDCKTDRGRRRIARDWLVRSDGLHLDADWVYLAAEVYDRDFHMVMAEDANQRSSCIAWCCPVVVVAADNCATRQRRLAAYEVQN